MWGWSELKWVDRRGCGPAGGQWDKQDGQTTAGKVAGASCDWLGGNIEKLIRQITYC